MRASSASWPAGCAGSGLRNAEGDRTRGPRGRIELPLAGGQGYGYRLLADELAAAERGGRTTGAAERDGVLLGGVLEDERVLAGAEGLQRLAAERRLQLPGAVEPGLDGAEHGRGNARGRRRLTCAACRGAAAG